jgi:hypothetical protein
LYSQSVVREFLSKSIAGGLSAGVVLLWWPVLFDRVDTVTSWFARGVAWTVLFELLLCSRCIPFERAHVGDGAARTSRPAASAPPGGSTPARRGAASAGSAPRLDRVLLPVVLLVTGLHRRRQRADTNAVRGRSRSCA